MTDSNTPLETAVCLDIVDMLRSEAKQRRFGLDHAPRPELEDYVRHGYLLALEELTSGLTKAQ